MSGERANLAAVVILTTSVTSVVIFGGWFFTTQYFNQPAPAAPVEAAAPPPAPKHKAQRPPKSDATHAGRQDDAAPTPAPDASAAPPTNQTLRNDEESDLPDVEVRGAGAPAASADGSRGRETAEAPASAAPSATPASENRSADVRADARTIMDEAQRRTEARAYQYDGLLQSFDAKDKVTEKRWTFDRVGSHGQSKAVLRFTSPAEVKGVALLIVNHAERASDQWMWTPAIERDRRIALQDRSTRFFGTDFSFEDLEERDVDQYEYAMLGNDTVDGAACWKIQTTPKQSRSSQYSRSIAWVRKDNYALARLDNFVKGEVVRRLTYSSIENIQGIWTARQLEMADLHRGSRTRLTLQQVKYNTPVKEDDFTLQAIRR